MGGKKTAGMVYSEAFALIKSRYKALWVIALVMYAVQTVLGIIMSLFMMPFQFASVFMGPMIDSMTRGGDPSMALRSLLPMLGVFGALYVVIIVLALAVSIVQGAAEVSAKKGTLQLMDGEQPKFEPLWQDLARNWKRYVGITAWTLLWTTLWSMLFIVPGIVKGYSYRLAPYLMLEYPHMTVREALNKSIEMTRGYKGRLFLLDLILFAFGLLSIVGICLVFVGMLAIQLLWLMPLYYTLFAIAYRDIKAAAIERGILPQA